MSRFTEARDQANRWLNDRAATLDRSPIAEALIAGIDKATEHRWEAALAATGSRSALNTPCSRAQELLRYAAG